jgi:hypothetical protein
MRVVVTGATGNVGTNRPPLDPHAGGPLRVGEPASGVGARNRQPWDR